MRILSMVAAISIAATPASAFDDYMLLQYWNILWDAYGDWEYDPDDYGDPCEWCDQPARVGEEEGQKTDDEESKNDDLVGHWELRPWHRFPVYVPDREELDAFMENMYRKRLSLQEKEKLEYDEAIKGSPFWIKEGHNEPPTYRCA